MTSVGIPANVMINMCARCTAPNIATYVVDSAKLSLVSKHHYLIFRITTNFRVFPIIDRYLSCFGAVIAGHVEYSASWNMLFFAARALFTDARRVIKIWVQRHCTSAEPRVSSLGRSRKRIDQERHAEWRGWQLLGSYNMQATMYEVRWGLGFR